MMQTVTLVLVAVIALAFLVNLFIFARYFGIWTRALTSGHPVPLVALIGMTFRRVPPRLIVDSYIRARNGDLDVTTGQLEKHYVAGGKPDRVVDALIRARSRDIDVPFDLVAKTDLAGFDVDEVDPEEFRQALGQPEGEE